jgi:hypothetical protein
MTLSEVAILKHDHKGDRKHDSCSGASVELLAKQHEQAVSLIAVVAGNCTNLNNSMSRLYPSLQW